MTIYILDSDQLSEFNVLQYDAKSQQIFQALKAQRIRVGTQDLRIASI